MQRFFYILNRHTVAYNVYCLSLIVVHRSDLIYIDSMPSASFHLDLAATQSALCKKIFVTGFYVCFVQQVATNGPRLLTEANRNIRRQFRSSSIKFLSMCATWNRNSYLDAVYTTELITYLSYLLLILDVFAFLASWRIMRLCSSVYDTIDKFFDLLLGARRYIMS